MTDVPFRYCGHFGRFLFTFPCVYIPIIYYDYCTSLSITTSITYSVNNPCMVQQEYWGLFHSRHLVTIVARLLYQRDGEYPIFPYVME